MNQNKKELATIVKKNDEEHAEMKKELQRVSKMNQEIGLIVDQLKKLRKDTSGAVTKLEKLRYEDNKNIEDQLKKLKERLYMGQMPMQQMPPVYALSQPAVMAEPAENKSLSPSAPPPIHDITTSFEQHPADTVLSEIKQQAEDMKKQQEQKKQQEEEKKLHAKFLSGFNSPSSKYKRRKSKRRKSKRRKSKRRTYKRRSKKSKRR